MPHMTRARGRSARRLRHGGPMDRTRVDDLRAVTRLGNLRRDRTESICVRWTATESQRGPVTVVAAPADGRHSWLGVALTEQVGTDPQEHGGVDQCHTELRPLRPQVRVVLADGH
jgi:hypothetical protein